jgi:hypothetical protein
MKRLITATLGAFALLAPTAFAHDTLTCALGEVGFYPDNLATGLVSSLTTISYHMNGSCVDPVFAGTDLPSPSVPIGGWGFPGLGYWTGADVCGASGTISGRVEIRGLPDPEGPVMFNFSSAMTAGSGPLVITDATDQDGDSGGTGTGTITFSPGSMVQACLDPILGWQGALTFTIAI